MKDKFLQEYDGHIFADCGVICSEDYKTFAKAFKAYLKRKLPKDCELIGFKANHYDHSGFVKYGNDCVYVSYSWDRFSPVNIYEAGARNGVLVRRAKDERDFTGETNRFTSLSNLPTFIEDMLGGATC